MTPEEASEELFSRTVRHRIALERYSSGVVADILRFIREMERDTLRRVAALQAEGVGLDRAERLRLESLEGFLRELRLIYAEGYTRLREEAFDNLDELARFEREFNTRSLNRALDDLVSVAAGASEAVTAAAAAGVLTPNVAQLRAIVRSRPLQTDTKSALLEAWFDDLQAAGIDRVESALRIGFAEGESIAAMRERLRNVWSLNERGAEAVIRTAATHIAAEVAQETYEANPEIINQVEWVAVLDSRTTPICRARDGKRFPLNGGPRPPAHIRCRSTVIPVIDGLPPPPRLTYGEWLARQSVDVQDDILGTARGKLFRAGGLPVDRFVGRDGDALTLEQIKQRFPEIYQRSGAKAPPGSRAR